MSEQKHTPEPWLHWWTCNTKTATHTVARTQDGDVVIVPIDDYGRALPCVNACTGMADPAGEIATLRARLAELEAIVEKLPVTKDGVRITDGMPLYRETRWSGKVEEHTAVVYARAVSDRVSWSAEDCYSTLSAAESAAKGGE